MKNMKVKFKMDIKNPGRRTCYSKITNIESFDTEKFQVWMAKNFENIMKENYNDFTDESVVKLEYIDMDDNNTYTYIVDFNDDSYKFYINGELNETMTLNDLFVSTFNILGLDIDANANTNTCKTENIEVEQDVECNNPVDTCAGTCEPIDRTTLRDIVNTSFNNCKFADDTIEILKDYLVFKITEGDFQFVSQINPIVQYNYKIHDGAVAIIIDLDDIKLTDANISTMDIENLREYVQDEGFKDVAFNSDVSKIALML